MSINLYKKKTINNQPVLEELLSKSTDTVDNKPLVYDSTTDNVKSVDNLTVNTVTANCFHGPLDGTAKNATCFNNKTYAEACADILSGCAADSNKLNGKTYSEVCADILSGCAADSNMFNGKTYSEACTDILSGTAANATCFAGKTCTEWKDIIKTTCVDNAALATNSICFNGCTYAQAKADIRDGLATQTCVDAVQACANAVQACADAVQNCADFIQSCVSAIESKIPAQASSSNQLADKDFVNSSITTNTANFRGTYSCVADLPSTGNTNNDYAFVCSLNTTTGNYIYDRYKWVASDSCWVCEYELNTTGFTAEQLASINSGITSNLVAKITDVYDNTVTVCMNGECKGSFSLNQNTDVCIDLGNSIRNACCANYATNAAQASEATNATCFNGCTYSEAKEDFRNGMAAAISIGNSCPYQADGNRVVHIPAYPPDLSSCDGLDCTGTVTQVKVGTTAYDPVSGIVSLPEYPTIPTTVCTAECANTVKRNTANSGSCYLALFDGNTAVSNANLYVSSAKQISFCPYTGCLSTCYVRGISGLIAGNPIGCTSSVLGQAGTNISSGTVNLYANNPSIGFHVNRSAVTSHCITATCGNLTIAVTNGTGCTDSTETAQFKFYSGGTLIAQYLDGTAAKATRVARCPTAITNAYYLPLFDANTASSGTLLFVSCCCPITYCPANGTLTTCHIIVGNPVGCTSTVTGYWGTDLFQGWLSLYKDYPEINFHFGNASVTTHSLEACCGRLNIDVNNASGCCASTQSARFSFHSDGTIWADCFWGKSKNTTCFDDFTYAQAKADIRNYTPSLATCATNAGNSTCFNGCTYACARADIRSGLISDIGVNVYCGTTCKCTLCKASSLCLSANAFNANATISTTTYPGACKTGTVTSVNVSVNGCSGTAVTTSGTVTLTNVPTCRIYKTMATASCNRNVLLGETTEAAGYGCVYVGNCCKLTFNPATGILTAKTFCGALCGQASTSTVSDFTSINCYVDDSNYDVVLSPTGSGTLGSVGISESAHRFTFNPNSGLLYSDAICTDTLYACGEVHLGAQCDICIYDACGNNFICAWGNSLTIGYNSVGLVTSCNCCKVTIGLNNYIYTGSSCGNSVVVGFCNCVCWKNEDYLGLIYGAYNTTNNGGLAVGGWNIAGGECAVALGWDGQAYCCSVALGVQACSYCSYSIAIGCDVGACGDGAIAIGTDSRACGNCAIIIGAYASADADYRLSIGYGSNAATYGTACINSNIRKGALREITVTWCDATLRCDIWKAIACNLDLRKNGKGTILTSGCTYLSATGYINNNQIAIYACNYNYNSSMATMCSIMIRGNDGSDIIALSATCTTTASGGGSGGGFLTITGWSR